MIRLILSSLIAIGSISAGSVAQSIIKPFSTITTTSVFPFKTSSKLNLVQVKEIEKVEGLADSVFVIGDKTQIKPLIKAIFKYSKNATHTFATIITWALENNYSNILPFIQTMSSRSLRCKFQHNRPLKFYIFIQAIINHSNDIVEFLLPNISSNYIIEKDFTHTSPIEYAAQNNNQEAVSMITQHIEKLRQAEKNGWNFFTALVGGITWGILAYLTTPYYIVTYTPWHPIYRPIYIL